MIYIFSAISDRSSDILSLYLVKSGKSFIRINDDFKILDLNFKLEGDSNSYSFKIVTKGEQEYTIKPTDEIIFRRGKSMNYNLSGNLHPEIEKYLKIEKSFLLDALNNCSQFYYKEITNNKIKNLMTAQAVGFQIPETLVTSHKKELIEFVNRKKLVISKPLSNSHITYTNSNSNYFYHGKGIIIVNTDTTNQIGEYFVESLFQEYIEKNIEIRIFVFKDQIWSYAIFSQTSEQTKYDYRNPEIMENIRITPYQLPNDIELKVFNFMKFVGLQTGSIDLIHSLDNIYYFLEVNPFGMFNGISERNNGYLEKKICNLIN